MIRLAVRSRFLRKIFWFVFAAVLWTGGFLIGFIRLSVENPALQLLLFVIELGLCLGGAVLVAVNE